jgi:aminoglycoside phosphotransferase (APT) family kinase protein
MSQHNDMPSQDTVRAILEAIAPSHVAFSVQPLVGSYSNHTHRVNIEFADGSVQQIVMRRYNEANGDCIGKAQREYKALERLQESGLPIPKPIYQDDTGKLFGSPGIVTEFVNGNQIDTTANPLAWASKVDVIARMLAKIHKTRIDDELKPVLMDANLEAAWFLKEELAPDFMAKHPDGVMVWQTVKDLMPQREVIEPALLHVDYWSGNILWSEGEISAIVDWEEAAFGDPAIDVAYCRMELYLEGLDDAAEAFLRIYEKAVGQQVANLGLWELAAAARPMIDPSAWFTRPLMHERFRRFIVNAKASATS